MGPGIQRSTLDLEPHSNKESIFILWLRATSGKNNFEHWARLSISFFGIRQSLVLGNRAT